MAKSADFVTQLKGMIKEQINNIHTAIPGEIQSVDASAGTVTVQPKGAMIFSTGEKLDYPVIEDIPVIMPLTVNGDASVVFPVHSGDQCLLIFSEQALETWRGTGTIGSQLKHSLAGALCLPGLMKATTEDFKEACNDNAVIIREGKSAIKITNDGVTVSTDGKVDIESKGDTKVNASGKVDISGSSEVSVSTSGNANVSATGKVEVSGTSNVKVSSGLSSVELSAASAKIASGIGSITISSAGLITFGGLGTILGVQVITPMGTGTLLVT